MAARKRASAPRMLLIYCEGKTEEAYFNILLDFYRLPAYVSVEVHGQKGQHLALIDNTVAKREKLCASTGFSEGEIECWAVCDEDQMPCSYSDLERYATERGVRLAFSAPQFEMYLLQHFEQSGEMDKRIVFQKLTGYRNENGSTGEYCDATKADLDWLRTAIDKHPKIVKTVIVNSKLRNRTSKRPFLTVHELTSRIVELAI